MIAVRAFDPGIQALIVLSLVAFSIDTLPDLHPALRQGPQIAEVLTVAVFSMEKVEIKGLAKLTTLTMEDCTKTRQAYGRCSTLLYSSADALNPPRPGSETVQREITELREWVADIKQRQGEVEWLQ